MGEECHFEVTGIPLRAGQLPLPSFRLLGPPTASVMLAPSSRLCVFPKPFLSPLHL